MTWEDLVAYADDAAALSDITALDAKRLEVNERQGHYLLFRRRAVQCRLDGNIDLALKWERRAEGLIP